MKIANFTGLIVSSLLSFHAFAGQMGFKIQKDSMGRTQFRVVGQNLCDYGNAEYFTMVKGEVRNGRFEGTEQYVSSTGKKSWSVNDSNNCSINQQITNSLLEPGKAVAITTYTASGRAVEAFYLAVPCKNTLSVIETDYVFYREQELVNMVSCQAGGGGVVKDVDSVGTVVVPNPGTQPSREPVTQYCDADLTVDRNDQTKLNISIGCGYQDWLYVEIYVNGSPIGKLTERVVMNTYNKQYVGSVNIRRDQSAKVSVKMISPDFDYTRNVSEFLYKAPSFIYDTLLQLQSAERSRVEPQSKAFGRGVYFESEVVVYVEDKDIETDFPQQAIKVQIINTTKGKHEVVDTRTVSTGSVVTFDLMGQYIEPLLFGSDDWDEDGQLFEGVNTFKVRVFDAFSESKFRETQEISIEVRK